MANFEAFFMRFFANLIAQGVQDHLRIKISEFFCFFMENLQKIAKNENFYENEDSQTCIKMSIKPDF